MKRSKFSERQVLVLLKAVESGRKQTRSNSSSSSRAPDEKRLYTAA